MSLAVSHENEDSPGDSWILQRIETLREIARKIALKFGKCHA